MRRRIFISLFGAAVSIWPLTGSAQTSPIPVIGLLNGQLTAPSSKFLDAFRNGLAEAGFSEGRNLAIVYRSAEANIDRLPTLAQELVDLNVTVIAAVGGIPQ